MYLASTMCYSQRNYGCEDSNAGFPCKHIWGFHTATVSIKKKIFYVRNIPDINKVTVPPTYGISFLLIKTSSQDFMVTKLNFELMEVQCSATFLSYYLDGFVDNVFITCLT